MTYVLIGLMAGLGTIFAVSAVSKVRHRAARQDFVASLRELRLLPARHVGSVATIVTAAEAAVVLVAAWALVMALTRRPVVTPALVCLVLAGSLLTALTAGIALALHRGTETHCACFGVGRRLGRAHLIRNVLLLLAVAGGLLGVALESEAPADPAGTALGVVAGAVAGLLVTRMDDVIDLFHPDRQTV